MTDKEKQPNDHCSQCGAEIVGDAFSHVYFAPLCGECGKRLSPLYDTPLPQGHLCFSDGEIAKIKEQARKRAVDWHKRNPGRMPASATRDWARRVYGVGK